MKEAQSLRPTEGHEALGNCEIVFQFFHGRAAYDGGANGQTQRVAQSSIIHIAQLAQAENLHANGGYPLRIGHRQELLRKTVDEVIQHLHSDEHTVKGEPI